MRFIWLAFAAACTGPTAAETTETTEDSSVYTTGDYLPCGDSLPSVTFTVSRGATGLLNGEPNLELDLQMADDDGALQTFEIYLWSDTTIDDQIDTLIEPAKVSDSVHKAQRCEVSGASVRLNYPVLAAGLPLNTEVEFGVVLINSDGLRSELAVVSAITPHADGSEGDGSGTTGGN